MMSRDTVEMHAGTATEGHVVGVAELSDADDDKDEQR